MPRFYCPEPLAVGATIALPEAVAHHVNVLRMQPGDALCLFDGKGGEYVARLAGVDRRRASATIESHDPREAELPYAVTLAQALPEGS
ncbi:MAG: RsmE family RNA methyltransferase, partial [Telluria sp.]